MKIKKKQVVIFVIIIVLVQSGIGVYCGVLYDAYKADKLNKVVWADNNVSDREQTLLKFIEQNLVDKNYGVKTNYLEAKSEGDITKGSSVLSESEGLLLLYYLERDNKEGFDNVYLYIKENMVLKNKIISWRVDDGIPSETSATIDDLRIIKALLLANIRWNDTAYRKQGLKIAEALKTEMIEDNLLTDYKVGDDKSPNVTLCYLDLETLKMISNYDKDFKLIYNKSLKIMNEGYVSDGLPLYKKIYIKSDNTYDNDELDTLLSTIVMLNRAQVREDTYKSIEWIKDKFRTDGSIFLTYNKNTGQAMSSLESTSIYSNLLQVADYTKDDELYTMCLDKLEKFQVLEVNNLIYGGYGNAITKEVYSFDNLNALLAWTKVKNNNN